MKSTCASATTKTQTTPEPIPDVPPAPAIVVVGSINMDLVATVNHLPLPGETVAGHDFSTLPGGKGANQAVALAQLGANASLIGRVGSDSFGRQLLRGLLARGVETHSIATTEDMSSGVAMIAVDPAGENTIAIVPGANGRLTPDDIEEAEEVIAQARAVLLQLEIPIETVVKTLEIARRHHVFTVLDPAPAPNAPLPDALYAVDLISPNQSEARRLTGQSADDLAQAEAAAEILRQRGAEQVVIKMGALGALAINAAGQSRYIHGYEVDVVDTTAAGDAFTAALTLGCAEGMRLDRAVRFGCAAGALATTALGAQTAMPNRAEVVRLMDEQRY